MRYASMLVVAASIAWAGLAHAQAGAQERAVARGLFDQARELMQQGKYTEACPKLEESQRLDPGMGTQFNLGDCYEHVGRAASAWAQFLDVASAARAAGQNDREAVARERAKAIEPKVSKLLITVPEGSRVDGLELKVDGMKLGQGMWGAPLPMDAGEHKVEASAPGKKPWLTKATVPPEGKSIAVTVPVLESGATSAAAAPAAAPAPSASSTPAAPLIQPANPSADTGQAPDKSSWSTQKTVAAVVAGAGVVGLGVSGLIVMSAKSKYDDSSAYCSGNYCQPDGLSLRDDARSKGTIATIVGGIGLAAIGTGAVLFFTSPKSTSGKSEASSAPKVGIGPGWMTIGGQW